ncbi:MAG: type II secretion system F family protein [Moraxellaceae bacterium]|nr:type II secretion system F family protein [Moraxellaceae bacterium]
MTINLGLILLLVFVTTVFIIMGASHWLFGTFSPLKRRLREIADPKVQHAQMTTREGAFTVHFIEPVAKVMLPAEDWRKSRLKSRLVQAGFRQPKAVSWFLATKLIAAFVLPMLVVLPLLLMGMLGEKAVIGVSLLSVAGLIGFFGPDIFLQHRIEQRQNTIASSFPDALDMLVVCVEAGLGLDAAINRIASELGHAHPLIAEELQLVSLELRAGKQREAALRGLSDRTAVEEISALTSILVQSEQFGTSIASALREHADGMRLVRIQNAREKAAKLPVKLIFPIMLFIFPALFLVILGPAFIRIFYGFIRMGQ